MKVLITGGSGFIGHHIVDYLLQKTDWEIVLLERLAHSGNLNRLTELPSIQRIEIGDRLKLFWHDLRSPVNDFLIKNIGEVNYIIHLAASTHVDRSIENPMDFVMDNVVGTANLLDFARKQKGLKLFMNFSTDEVFGPAPDGVYHKETDSHKPSNPYSATKSGACQLAYSYFITYGLPIVNTFTMNNFGERQHPEKFIPKMIKKIEAGEPMPIYQGKDSTEKASRVWMYAGNTASAVHFLLENGKPGEGYNVIGPDELDLLTLGNKVAEILGKPLIPEFVGFYTQRPGHDRRYALDGSKMKEMGWIPPYSFEESLRKTVEFTRDNSKWM